MKSSASVCTKLMRTPNRQSGAAYRGGTLCASRKEFNLFSERTRNRICRPRGTQAWPPAFLETGANGCQNKATRSIPSAGDRITLFRPHPAGGESGGTAFPGSFQRSRHWQSATAEASFRNLLSTVESFCDQATRRIERANPARLPAGPAEPRSSWSRRWVDPGGCFSGERGDPGCGSLAVAVPSRCIHDWNLNERSGRRE